jgi:ATP-dependent DNA helicase RecQ
MRLAASDAPDDPAEVTLIVRKALSGVARVQGRFGLQMTVKLVHGDADPRLERAGLTRLPTFGNLREHPEGWLLRLLRRCVSAGWVTFSGTDRPVVVLTEDGRAVMKAERPARLLLPARGGTPDSTRAAAPPSLFAGARARERPFDAGASGVLDPTAEALFQALRRERLRLAQQEGMAPFMVASDRTLRELAVLKPRDLDELRRCHGIGPHKAERYGALLLEVVARFAGPPPGT